MDRPSNMPGAPPPPKRAALRNDALAQWLSPDDEAERNAVKGKVLRPPRRKGDNDEEARGLVKSAFDGVTEISIGDLRAKTGLGLFRLGTVLTVLENEGVISVEGDPGQELLRSVQ